VRLAKLNRVAGGRSLDSSSGCDAMQADRIPAYSISARRFDNPTFNLPHA